MDKELDFYYFDDFEDSDLQEAISDLKDFGVNDDELHLNFYDIDEYSN